MRLEPESCDLGASSVCLVLWGEICTSSNTRVTLGKSISAKVVNGLLNHRMLYTDLLHFRASTLSWAAFVCFFSAASEFVRIHKFCMSSSGDESVVASLVKVSFGECSAAALLCCMLHVSSAKLLNLLKFTIIAWVYLSTTFLWTPFPKLHLHVWV